MVGIIGKSGAGKSTLLRMLNRLVEPSEGSIHWNSTNVTTLKGAALRNWRRDCAMIFQQFNLVPRLDVLTNVMLGRLNHRSTLKNLMGQFGQAERLMAIAALDQLGIAQSAMQAAGTLSGGQQQRVAIARALLQDPQLILADEPIASLDPRNAQLVMQALRDINQHSGLTVVTNLHTLETARRFCDRIIGMADGRIVFDGTGKELTQEAALQLYGIDEESDGNDVFDESTTESGLYSGTPAWRRNNSPQAGNYGEAAA
jgi:phosphonate transport system ATP-binding protein